jgi:hypothetical protein
LPILPAELKTAIWATKDAFLHVVDCNDIMKKMEKSGKVQQVRLFSYS